MPEVLKLDYHAHTNSLIVKIDAVHAYERDGKKIVAPMVGVEFPARECTLEALAGQAARAGDASLVDDFRRLLERLEPIVRGWIEVDITVDPNKMRAEVARIADQRRTILLEQAEHDRQATARHAELAALDEQIKQKRAEAEVAGVSAGTEK